MLQFNDKFTFLIFVSLSKQIINPSTKLNDIHKILELAIIQHFRISLFLSFSNTCKRIKLDLQFQKFQKHKILY